MMSLRSRAGFTLTEILVAAAITVVVIIGVSAIFLFSMHSYYKTNDIDQAVRATRKFQDHLSREISSAASINSSNASELSGAESTYLGTTGQQNYPLNPITYSDPEPGELPGQNYGQIDYRVNVGTNLSHLAADTDYSTTTITVTLPATVRPAVGDYLMIDSPSLGRYGIEITNVGTLPADGASGDVTLTLYESLQSKLQTLNGWDSSEFTTNINSSSLASGTAVYFQRTRRYKVVKDSANPTTAPASLVWYENAISGSPITIATNIDPAHTGIFHDASSATSPDHPLQWSFPYLGDTSTLATLSNNLLGGRSGYFSMNDSTGELASKAEVPGQVGFTTVSVFTTSIPTTVSTSSTTSTTSSTVTTSSTSTTSASTSSVPSTTTTTKPSTTTAPPTTVSSTTSTISSTTTSPTTSKTTSTTTSTVTTTKATTTTSIPSTSTSTTTSTTTSKASTTTSSVATTTVSTTTKPSTTTTKASTTSTTTKPSTTVTSTKASTTTSTTTKASTTSTTTKASTTSVATTTKASTTSIPTTTSTTTKPATTLTTSTSTTTTPSTTTSKATTTTSTTTSIPTTTSTTKPSTTTSTTTSSVATTTTTKPSTTVTTSTTTSKATTTIPTTTTSTISTTTSSSTTTSKATTTIFDG